MVTANFLTEDTYLGNIIEPLTLNRYNYCVSSSLNYVDPSGNLAIFEAIKNWLAELFGWNKEPEEQPVGIISYPITTESPIEESVSNPEEDVQNINQNKPIDGSGYWEDKKEEAIDKNEKVECEVNIIDLRVKFRELAKEDPTLESIGVFMKDYYNKDVILFLEMLGMLESSNEYDKRGQKYKQYLGKYQIGNSSFEDINFKEKVGNEYQWTELAGEFGVASDEDYLNSPIAQEVAMVLILRRNYLYILTREQEKYIGDEISWTTGDGESKSVKVTLSGLIAASHLVGNGKLNQGLTGKTDWADVVDGNGTSALKYMDEMGGLDLSILFGGIE